MVLGDSKKIAIIINLFLGLFFIFSGFTKIVNPYGFSVKIEEYLQALSLDTLFSSITMLFGILLPAFEAILGLVIILRIYPKQTSYVTLLVAFFFTILTLWEVIEQPIGDCGCFGDIIKLTPLESFIKNVCLFVIAILYVGLSKKIAHMKNYRIAICISILFVAIPVYISFHLPLIDVSGYSVGSSLLEENDETSSVVYRDKLTGDVKEISLEELEKLDSLENFELVEVQNNGVASRFPIFREDFHDISADVFSSSDSTLIVIVQDPGEYMPSLKNIQYRTIYVSALEFPSEDKSGLAEYYSSDFSLLRQIVPNVRGGAMLVCNGLIMKKWALTDCPYIK